MISLKSEDYNLKSNQSGQAALSLVLLVGGTVVLIAATLFFLIISFINSTFGFQAANQAWGLALSGGNDALLQLSRNPTVGNTTYTFNVDGRPVKVEIKRGCVWEGISVSCRSSDTSGIKKDNQVLINSSAAVAGRSSRLSIFASVSPEGKVDIVEIKYFTPSGGLGG